jgi:glycosyltransferase involved in cell wall biosynthesis
MKILHVAEVTHGGVVSLVRTFAELQSADGHDVHVLTRPEVDQLPGTRHLWTPVRRSPRALVAAQARLREVVRTTQPDVVHLHSFFPGVLGRMRPLPPGPGVVYQPHSFAFDAVPSRLSWAVTAAERRGSRFTDRMVTNCGAERDEGVSHGIGTATTVVGLPLDTDRYAPQAGDRSALRAELGLTAGFVAVCVGRISRQKGQRALAEAWEAAAPADSVLVFVGPGDQAEIADAAPTTIGRTLICAGPQADVRPWLWAASVSVLPSLYEGQSVAMAEALACGVPVVMTDVNGAREAVCPPGQPATGAVVPVGDLPELLRQLERRRLAPELLAEEATLARSRAVEMFDSARVMERLETTYLDAISHARQRTPRRGR